MTGFADTRRSPKAEGRNLVLIGETVAHSRELYAGCLEQLRSLVPKRSGKCNCVGGLDVSRREKPLLWTRGPQFTRLPQHRVRVRISVSGLFAAFDGSGHTSP